MRDRDRPLEYSELLEAMRGLDANAQRAFLERECDDPALRKTVQAEIERTRLAATLFSDSGVHSDAPATFITRVGIPTMIGAYQVLGVLGSGAMGTVYEAEQTNPRRRVALKVLKSVVVSVDVLRRFDHEAHVLGLLQHPGIAQIIEAGTFDHGDGVQPFFAMEFVDGQALGDYAATHSLSVRDRLALCATICDGVHHAHQRGVVHRDIKPANILVTKEGQPKVLDFGVARLTNAESAGTMLTLDGQVIGTLGYMSPEQAMGDPDLDTSSDVYSLGIVLYELLCGALPYPVASMTLHQAIRTIIEVEATPLGSVDRRLKGDVETLVHKALRKEKRARYESAAALADDLRRYLRNEPISARRPTAVYQLRKFARRNRALVTALFLVMLALVGGLLVSLSSLKKVKDARGEAEREAAIARAINEFILQDMLRAASPFEGGREVKVVDVLAATGPRLEHAFADQPLVRAAVRVTLGRSYRQLGLWKEAEKELRQAVLDRTARLGPEDPETQDARYELAKCQGALSNNDAALAEFESLYEEWRVSRGESDAKTLRVMGDKAAMLARLGKFDDALRLGQDANERCIRQLGPNHEATMATQQSLAYSLVLAGRYAEAEELFEKFLTTREALKGPSDPDALETRLELSYLLSVQVKYDDAEREILGVIQRIEDTFGPYNVRALNAKSSLASLYDLTGRADKATELHEVICSEYERSLGRAHPSTLVARNNLAIHLRHRGVLERAEQIARQVLEDRLIVFGANHESIATSSDTLAVILQRRDDRAGAAEMFDRACEVASAAWGPEHPQTLDILSNRANLTLNREDYANAEAQLRDLIDACSRAYGPDHPYLVTEMRRLGEALIGQDKLDDAVSVLTQAIALAKTIGPNAERDGLRSALRLGTAFLLQGRPGDAEEPLLFCYHGLKDTGRERDMRELMVVEALVLMYQRLERPEEVLRFQTELTREP